MKVIWKYQLPIKDQITIKIPVVAKFLKFEYQDDVPTIWVEVDPETERVPKHFKIIATGQRFDESHLQYLGTVQRSNGALIWHLYVRQLHHADTVGAGVIL
jgi:hypothetical protein